MGVLEGSKGLYPEIMTVFFEEKELESKKKIEKKYFSKFV